MYDRFGKQSMSDPLTINTNQFSLSLVGAACQMIFSDVSCSLPLISIHLIFVIHSGQLYLAPIDVAHRWRW